MIMLISNLFLLLQEKHELIIYKDRIEIWSNSSTRDKFIHEKHARDRAVTPRKAAIHSVYITFAFSFSACFSSVFAFQSAKNYMKKIIVKGQTFIWQTDVRFSCVCLVIDHKFRLKVHLAVDSRSDCRVDPQTHNDIIKHWGQLVFNSNKTKISEEPKEQFIQRN